MDAEIRQTHLARQRIKERIHLARQRGLTIKEFDAETASKAGVPASLTVKTPSEEYARPRVVPDVKGYLKKFPIPKPTPISLSLTKKVDPITALGVAMQQPPKRRNESMQTYRARLEKAWDEGDFGSKGKFNSISEMLGFGEGLARRYSRSKPDEHIGDTWDRHKVGTYSNGVDLSRAINSKTETMRDLIKEMHKIGKKRGAKAQQRRKLLDANIRAASSALASLHYVSREMGDNIKNMQKGAPNPPRSFGGLWEGYLDNERGWDDELSRNEVALAEKVHEPKPRPKSVTKAPPVETAAEVEVAAEDKRLEDAGVPKQERERILARIRRVGGSMFKGRAARQAEAAKAAEDAEAARLKAAEELRALAEAGGGAETVTPAPGTGVPRPGTEAPTPGTGTPVTPPETPRPVTETPPGTEAPRVTPPEPPVTPPETPPTPAPEQTPPPGGEPAQQPPQPAAEPPPAPQPQPVVPQPVAGPGGGAGEPAVGGAGQNVTYPLGGPGVVYGGGRGRPIMRNVMNAPERVIERTERVVEKESKAGAGKGEGKGAAGVGEGIMSGFSMIPMSGEIIFMIILVVVGYLILNFFGVL